jgi:hypothetical protein
MIKAKGTVLNSDKESLKKMYDKLKELEPGSYKYFFTDKKKNRSLNQNRYYHGVIIKILCGHTGFRPYEMHEYIKRKFNPVIVTDPETGEQMETGGSTAEMNTKQFTDFIDEIRDWSFNNLGCYIPEPGEVPDELLID